MKAPPLAAALMFVAGLSAGTLLSFATQERHGAGSVTDDRRFVDVVVSENERLKAELMEASSKLAIAEEIAAPPREIAAEDRWSPTKTWKEHAEDLEVYVDAVLKENATRVDQFDRMVAELPGWRCAIAWGLRLGEEASSIIDATGMIDTYLDRQTLVDAVGGPAKLKPIVDRYAAWQEELAQRLKKADGNRFAVRDWSNAELNALADQCIAAGVPQEMVQRMRDLTEM